MTDNTKRFSDRVEDYIKFRPNYPESLVSTLEQVIGLDHSKTIADIGSGTGISSLPFLRRGYTVTGVEPNKEMREAAERLLFIFPNFRSVNGSAEKTNLSDHSVDVIFCGQSFHWFHTEKAKTEFSRILARSGNIVLVWNERSMKSEFQIAYDQILNQYIDQYKFVNHRNVQDNLIAQFFSPKILNKASLENTQILSFDGLVGRLRSSSYCPKSGKQYDSLLREIAILFDKYKNEDTIVFQYETKIYWC